MAHTQLDEAAPSGDSAPSAGNKWWTLVAVCLGTFMLLLDVTIVNVALPDIQRALHTSFADLQWVIDAYALTLAALLLTAGSLADIFGRRRLYLIGLAIFTLSSLACGISRNTLSLQLARGMQGVGGAIMFAVSLALLANAFRGKDRSVALGIWGAITGLAVAAGPLLGGALTSGLSWRWIFLVNLPVGVIAVAVTVLRVGESKAPHARRPDWAGFIIFSAALSFLVYGLIEANERTFGDARVLSCLAIGAVLLAAFIAVEAVGKNPMFDLGLFRLPTFSGGAVAAFGVSCSIFSLSLYLILYLQDLLGYSALQAGLRFALVSAGVLSTSVIAGRLTSKVPVRLLISLGLVLIGVGILLMRGLNASSGWTHLIAGLIISGAGVGFVNPALASTSVGVVTPERAGMASGVNSTFRQMGIATGIALLGTLFSTKVNDTVTSLASRTPGLAAHAHALAGAVRSGTIKQTIGSLPAANRAAAGTLAKSAFTSGLNFVCLVAAIIALVSAVICFFSIRSKDFVRQESAAS